MGRAWNNAVNAGLVERLVDGLNELCDECAVETPWDLEPETVKEFVLGEIDATVGFD